MAMTEIWRGMGGEGPVLAHVWVPLAAGSLFFGLALYCRKIAPMRVLVTGNRPYQAAFWGFLAFGSYLVTRPVQVLMGPHPMPLLLNDLREMFLIGLFGPAATIAMVSLALGPGRSLRRFARICFGVGIVLAVLFGLLNIFAIGGSEPAFWFGDTLAHDGVWFDRPDPSRLPFLVALFFIRVADPVLFVAAAATVVFWKALTYPVASLYDNMSRKLLFHALAAYCFSFSMLFTGVLIAVFHVPNQWWIYYLGALAAGLLEIAAIRLPVSRVRRLTDHG